MEDREIICLYQQRDEQAITQTVRKYGAYCSRIASNILSDPLDREECVNDTWLRIWNAVPPEEPVNLRLYLACIVRNLCLDRFRANHRQKRSEEFRTVLEELTEFAGELRPMDSELEKTQFMTSVNQGLRMLPERASSIFIRRYFYGEPVGAIAERFEMRQAAVWQELSRTRKRLRKHLEKEGYGYER